MAGDRPALFPSIENLLQDGTLTGLDDAALLERYVTRQDNRAFAALVAAHGPMVLGVCRRTLHHSQDVHDAFQSTILVLARRAVSLRDPRRLGSWLHGVAWRVAKRIRDETQSNRWHDRDVIDVPASSLTDPQLQAERHELVAMIDQEVDRLPLRYRDVVVLCDLEGRTYAEASRQLGCPVGTIQSRLYRGRERLRGQLVRRGVHPGIVTVPLIRITPFNLPESLLAKTLQSIPIVQVEGVVTCATDTLMEQSLTFPRSIFRTLTAMVSLLLGACLALPASGDSRVEQRSDVLTAAQSTGPDHHSLDEPDQDRMLLIEVRGAEDNQPLAGASIWIQVKGGNSREPIQGKTDPKGRYSIELPGGPIRTVTLVAAIHGRVPKELSWQGDHLPINPVIGLERGVPIGGRVVNDEGRPIAGARVLPGSLNAGEDIAGAVTDEQGRWQSHSLAAASVSDNEQRLHRFRAMHPDHVTVIQEITAKQAQAQASVFTLKRGRSLAGRIVGPDGQPVARALVVTKQQGMYGPSTHQAETDAAGKFRFGASLDPKWTSVYVTVQSPGLAADSRELLITKEMRDLVIALDRPRPLRGLVIDSKGNPVPDAVVSPTWLGSGPLDWGGVTDAKGRFEWIDAPTSGTFGLDLRHSGFEEALGRQVRGDQREITITLHRPLHLHGTVTDAVTGHPVRKFSLIPGWGPEQPGDEPRWLTGSAQPRSNGRFDIVGNLFPDQGYKRSIRIEADGYLPAELVGFRDDAEDIGHDFKLKSARPLSGIVRDRVGHPLRAAMVGLSGPGNDLRVVNGRIDTSSVVGQARVLTTGPDGRFSFQPQEQPVTIVVAHETGFAVRTPEQLAESTDVRVEPWGVIEGVFKIGGHPAPGRKISAWKKDQSFSGRVDYDTMTDSQGRFRLERVTPGAMEVYHYVDNQDNRGWTPSNPVLVELSPGQHVSVQVGGMGRPVVGRLRVPAGFSVADFVASETHLTTTRPEPHQPDDFPDLTDDQRYAWYERFYKTPEGRAYYEGERRYAIDLRTDGTFRAEDVPAGDYEIEMHLRGRQQPAEGGLFAVAHGKVKVDRIPGGRSDEPLDCGEVRLEVFRHRVLNIGDPVPAMTRNLPDGRPLDLGALRGKFVLLHFWETYQKRELADLPALKETWEEFGRDPRFVMIGLNLNRDFDLPRRYAARKGLGWQQRHAGLERPNALTAAFGVLYPPEVLFIGPDGRLVAKALDGDAIKQTVRAALGQRK